MKKFIEQSPVYMDLSEQLQIISTLLCYTHILFNRPKRLNGFYSESGTHHCFECFEKDMEYTFPFFLARGDSSFWHYEKNSFHPTLCGSSSEALWQNINLKAYFANKNLRSQRILAESRIGACS